MLRLIACFFLLAASCARQAEPYEAEKSFLVENTLTLASNLQRGGGGWDTQLRSVSLVIFPTVEDLEGFIYSPNERMENIWENMATHLPYGNRLLRRYTTDMTDEDKLKKLVTTVVAVAELRTGTYRTQIPLQSRAEEMAVEIKRENALLKDQISNVSCYYEEELEDGTFQCHPTQGMDNRLKQKNLRSCRSFNKHHFLPDNDDLGELEPILQGCRELEEQRDGRSAILSRIDEQENLRKAGESVLLDLLLTAEEHSREKSFLVVGGAKSLGIGDEQTSTLVIEEGTGMVRNMTLFLDFGLNYSEGGGFREYSVANGKITELRMEKRGWADVLNFTVHTADFTLKATLSMTVQELLDLRFVGDVQVAYPDGSTSEGLMTLELDRIIQ